MLVPTHAHTNDGIYIQNIHHIQIQMMASAYTTIHMTHTQPYK